MPTNPMETCKIMLTMPFTRVKGLSRTKIVASPEVSTRFIYVVVPSKLASDFEIYSIKIDGREMINLMDSNGDIKPLPAWLFQGEIDEKFSSKSSQAGWALEALSTNCPPLHFDTCPAGASVEIEVKNLREDTRNFGCIFFGMSTKPKNHPLWNLAIEPSLRLFHRVKKFFQ